MMKVDESCSAFWFCPPFVALMRGYSDKDLHFVSPTPMLKTIGMLNIKPFHSIAPPGGESRVFFFFFLLLLLLFCFVFFARKRYFRRYFHVRNDILK